MATQKALSKRTGTVTQAGEGKHSKAEVQAALQATFVLKGTLKRVQLMFLRVGYPPIPIGVKKAEERFDATTLCCYAALRNGGAE